MEPALTKPTGHEFKVIINAEQISEDDVRRLELCGYALLVGLDVLFYRDDGMPMYSGAAIRRWVYLAQMCE